MLLGVLLTWALIAYLRGLLRADPAPALHGAGLALVVLNAVMLALLGSGIWFGRESGAPHRRLGVVLLLGALGTAMALYALAPDVGSGFFISMAGLWMLLMWLPVPGGITVSALTIAVIGGLGEVFASGGADLGQMAAVAGITLGALASRRGKAAQEATRRAEAANAVLAERSHIAREIHDILAHSLSAQIVHLEGRGCCWRGTATASRPWTGSSAHGTSPAPAWRRPGGPWPRSAGRYRSPKRSSRSSPRSSTPVPGGPATCA
ncbi:histidine kinase [Actinomadura luteofluorescens]|uniref:histidine kinase n=1 Tax=Actinomadura luteofluorescens TaxID=46163 RepID=UPI003644B818